MGKPSSAVVNSPGNGGWWWRSSELRNDALESHSHLGRSERRRSKGRSKPWQNSADSIGTGVGLVEAYDLDPGADSLLANISTRGLVQTDDNVMIGGFIVVGDTPKRVIGPSLTTVPNRLANPTLELRNGNGVLLQSNDDWMDAPNHQEIIDSTLAPSNDLESAVLTTLPADNARYTAIVRGVNGTTGVALVEVYSL